MRGPVDFAASAGFRTFAVAQVLFAGLLLSALVYPLMLSLMTWTFWHLAAGNELRSFGRWLLLADFLSVVSGFSVFLILGISRMRPIRFGLLLRIASGLPVYWLLQSVAAWRAVWQVFADPYKWEKTPHTPVARDHVP